MYVCMYVCMYAYIYIYICTTSTRPSLAAACGKSSKMQNA